MQNFNNEIDKICISHPTTNRGVENTQKVKKVPFSSQNLDFFTCTLKKHNILEILEWFGPGEKGSIFQERGLFGYRKSYICHSKCYVFFDHPHNQDILIWLSGKSCREIYKYHDWKDFFNFITKYDYVDDRTGEYIRNYNVTRIDLATDFYNYRFNLVNKVRHYVKSNLLCSKFKSNISFEKNSCDGDLLGNSIRFGSMASDISIIFYDKKLERNCNDYEVSNDIYSWHRMEVNYRGDKAMQLFDKLISDYDNVSDFNSSVIYNYLDFKDKGNDCNKSRLKTSKWWIDLLNTVSKERLTNYNITSTIMEKRAWINNSVSKSLLLVLATDKNLLSSILENGYDKIKVNDLLMLQEYFRSNTGLDNYEYLSNLDLVSVKELVKNCIIDLKK